MKETAKMALGCLTMHHSTIVCRSNGYLRFHCRVLNIPADASALVFQVYMCRITAFCRISHQSKTLFLPPIIYSDTLSLNVRSIVNVYTTLRPSLALLTVYLRQTDDIGYNVLHM